MYIYHLQGEPKAIPWTHTTPLRCAVDGWSLQDIQPGNVVAWPTNLGWMMGPWLLYASLLNGATIALYQVQQRKLSLQAECTVCAVVVLLNCSILCVGCCA
jgi:acyl-coenzyme A synthetase/AMP-(fatty) acid ligase